MSKTETTAALRFDDGGSAFPQTWHPDMGCSPTCTPPGMSLRDYFAAQALYAVCRCDGIDYRSDADESIVQRRRMMAAACYRYADALLAARQETPND